jgi:WD40 repeat protein
VVRIASVAITPDGKRALSAGEDGQIRVYDPENGRILRHIHALRSPILALAVSPGGHEVIAGGQDPEVRIWDIGTGRPAGVLSGCTPPVQCLAFGPRGNRVFAGDASTLRIRSAAAVTPVKPFSPAPKQPMIALAIAPGNELAYVAHSDQIFLYDLTTGSETDTIGVVGSAKLTALDLSADGRLLIGGFSDGMLCLWEAAAGAELRRFEKHAARINSVQFSSDARTAVTAGGAEDPTIRLWDVRTGRERARLEGHTDAVTRAIFTPGDRQVLSGSLDKSVRLWTIPE